MAMNNYITESAKRQSELDSAKAAFEARGGKVKQIPSRQVLPPQRKVWIDPETVLQRRRMVKPSNILAECDRALADQLKIREMGKAL